MSPRRTRGLHIALAATLLAQFILLAGVKIARDAGGETWWLSHVSLLLAAAGVLRRSPLLVGAALTNVLLLHALWIVDCAVGLSTGTFPLAITSRMQDADGLAWLATAHHLYLVPVLFVYLWSGRTYRMASLAVSAACFMALSVACRFTVDPALNVNATYALLPDLGNPVLAWMNGLSMWPYLALLNAWAIVAMFFPAAVILQRLAGPRLPAAAAAALTESRWRSAA